MKLIVILLMQIIVATYAQAKSTINVSVVSMREIHNSNSIIAPLVVQMYDPAGIMRFKVRCATTGCYYGYYFNDDQRPFDLACEDDDDRCASRHENSGIGGHPDMLRLIKASERASNRCPLIVKIKFSKDFLSAQIASMKLACVN